MFGAQTKTPWRGARAFRLGILTMTYFRAVYPALSSARRRFTVLFGMGRRGSSALCSSGIRLRVASARTTRPRLAARHFGRSVGRDRTLRHASSRASRKAARAWGYRIKPHGQLVPVSSRPHSPSTPGLSTGWSIPTLQGGYPPGHLISRRASRLDAFSGYRFRTWLPGDATGVTTGTPAVRPLRSSRTRSSPCQMSSAHGR